jgi:hypothetical protein
LEIKGEYSIPASREQVWQALNDPEVLKQCIPGCEEIEKQSDTELTAAVTAKVGPVKAKFKGKMTLSDLDPPNGYTISGEGQGGAAGFARGGARVTLAAEGVGTRLNYEVDATVGGKLAQIGSRLIQGTAKKMADEFFSSFTVLLGGEAGQSEKEQKAAAEAEIRGKVEDAEQTSGLNPMIWIGAVILLWMLAQWYFSGGN